MNDVSDELTGVYKMISVYLSLFMPIKFCHVQAIDVLCNFWSTVWYVHNNKMEFSPLLFFD